MGTMEAKTWWANFGAETPLLQTLAFRVLDQPTSSSCSERNWSTYSFVNSLRRNKLTPKRAEDLVFVHNNLRLLSRSTEQYLDEKTKMWDVKMWDVGGDEFGTMEDTGFLELAQLSLDEPELESGTRNTFATVLSVGIYQITAYSKNMGDIDINTLTMEQYMALIRDNNRPGVVRPEIGNDIDFEIKSQFMKELRRNLFAGTDDEDAHEHVRRVLEIMDLFHIPGVTHDAIMLRVFPITLTGAARRWKNMLPAGLINT
ncbi:hypothetical protein Tco_0970619 [Tanacetum coccineum]